MALFKIFKGESDNLNKNRDYTVEGYCYFTIDDHKLYIDIANGTDLKNNRLCLNAERSDYAGRLENESSIGDENHPVYFIGGVPAECEDTLIVDIIGNATTATDAENATLAQKSIFLVDASTGNEISIGSDSEPIYFENGLAKKCGSTLNVNVSGNASYSDGAGWAIYLSDGTTDAEPIGVGDINTPVYFVNGMPVACNKLKLDATGSAYSPIYINNDGQPAKCVDFLPLTAGENKKISGPLGLTENINYNSTIPTSGFEGEIFFIENNNNELYLPIGGQAGQILSKNSNANGDVKWTTLNYLPLTGGTMTGALNGTYFSTTNYGYSDPNNSTPGYGVAGALYFKLLN